MTHSEIRNIYAARRYARKYILGYDIDGIVYFTVVNGELPDYCFKNGKTSDKGTGESFNAIRFRPSKIEKLKIGKLGMTYKLGELETLDDETYNRGDMLEKKIWEFFGLTGWKKNSTRFDKGADIVLMGEGYEIKFQNGTFAHERVCAEIEGE